MAHKCLNNHPWYTIGSRVDILLKPEDIILSREPIRTSARNMIKTMIAKFVDHGQGIINIHLKIDRILIISTITKRVQLDFNLVIAFLQCLGHRHLRWFEKNKVYYVGTSNRFM